MSSRPCLEHEPYLNNEWRLITKSFLTGPNASAVGRLYCVVAANQRDREPTTFSDDDYIAIWSSM